MISNNKKQLILLIISLSALIFFSLKSVILRPGIIGHTWDWGLPNFFDQYLSYLFAVFFVWEKRVFAGFFYPMQFGLSYWLFSLPLIFFGGKYFTNLNPFLMMLLAGLTMFYLARKTFRLSFFWSNIAAIFYAFSPFVYSRLIAGHLPMILSYSLYPLLALMLFDLAEVTSWHSSLKKIFLSILIFPFLCIHLNLILLAWLLLGLFFIYSFLKNKQKAKVFLIYFLLIAGFFLVNSYAIFPFAYNFLSAKQIKLRPWENTNTQEYLVSRKKYLENVGQPLFNLFSLKVPQGMSTEFVWPIPSWLEPYFRLTAILISSLTFAVFFIIKKNRSAWQLTFLFIVFLIGIILCAGTNTIFGKLLYYLIFTFLPIVGTGLPNTLRFLPLVILSQAIIFPKVLAQWEIKLPLPYKNTLKIVSIILLIIFFYPWLFGDLTKPVSDSPDQPLSLKLHPLLPEEITFFNFLKKMPADFRVIHLPLYFISYPGETEFSYNWNIFSLPKGTFAEHFAPPLAETIIRNLYSKESPPVLDKLLGLAAVKIIYYPHYGDYGSYHNIIPGQKFYKKFVDQNLTLQKNIELIKTDFTSMDVYENKSFLPHFYIPNSSYYLDAKAEALADIAALPSWDQRPAVYLKNQQDNEFFLKSANKIFIKPDSENKLKEEEFGFTTLDKLGKTDSELDSYFNPPPAAGFEQESYNQMIEKEEKEEKMLLDKKAKLLDIKLFHANKRISELIFLLNRDKNTYPQFPLTTIISNYQQKIADIFNLLEDLKQQKKPVFFPLIVEVEYALGLQNRKIPNGIINFSELYNNLNKIKIKHDFAAWEYVFQIDNPGDYQIFLKLDDNLKEKQDVRINNQLASYSGSVWQKVAVKKFNQGENKITVKLPEPTNLIKHQCQSVNKGKNILTCKIQDYTPLTTYKLSLQYSLSAGQVNYLVAENEEIDFDKDIKLEIGALPAWGSLINTQASDNNEVEIYFRSKAEGNSANLYFINNNLTNNPVALDFSKIKLEKVADAQIILENLTNKTPAGTLPKITFKRINPAKYLVDVQDAQTPFSLIFSESFHPQWKVYKTNSRIDNEEIVASYFNNEVKEKTPLMTFLNKNTFETWGKKPLAEDKHFFVNGFANSWYISPKDVNNEKNYQLVVEFWPQRLFYLGLGLSIIIYLTSLSFVIYYQFIYDSKNNH